MCFASNAGMQKISADEVKQRLDRGDALVFIDSRSHDAWQNSDVQIPNSLRVPPDQAAAFAGSIPDTATIITYCT